jgi:hypothetical protein
MPFVIWLLASSYSPSSIAARARLTVLLAARNLVRARMVGKSPFIRYSSPFISLFVYVDAVCSLRLSTMGMSWWAVCWECPYIYLEEAALAMAKTIASYWSPRSRQAGGFVKILMTSHA